MRTPAASCRRGAAAEATPRRILMLGRSSRTAVTLALTLLALAGCRTGSGQPAAPSPPPSPPLRVGVTPSSPPFAFRQGGELVGLDVDFARALAGALGRPLQLREVDWDDRIPTLLAGRTDVIMSGMTITPARQVRMAFSDPYLSSGLLAVVRWREDGTRERILSRWIPYLSRLEAEVRAR